MYFLLLFFISYSWAVSQILLTVFVLHVGHIIAMALSKNPTEIYFLH